MIPNEGLHWVQVRKGSKFTPAEVDHTRHGARVTVLGYPRPLDPTEIHAWGETITTPDIGDDS